MLQVFARACHGCSYHLEKLWRNGFSHPACDFSWSSCARVLAGILAPAKCRNNLCHYGSQRTTPEDCAARTGWHRHSNLHRPGGLKTQSSNGRHKWTYRQIGTSSVCPSCIACQANSILDAVQLRCSDDLSTCVHHEPVHHKAVRGRLRLVEALIQTQLKNNHAALDQEVLTR